MNVQHEEYRNIEQGSNLYIIPNEDYIPLAQLLYWMHSFKIVSTYSFKPKVSFFTGRYGRNFTDESILLAAFKEDTEKEKYLDYPILVNYRNHLSIDNIISRNKYPSNCTQQRSGTNFISGWGLFGVPDKLNQFNCIFCTVVHKYKVLEVINCILENKEIDNSLLEIWYNSNIRLRGSDYFKSIRAKVNSYIKELENQGIKSVGMSEIPFFKVLTLPRFNNLSEKKDFIRNIYKKMVTL